MMAGRIEYQDDDGRDEGQENELAEGGGDHRPKIGGRSAELGSGQSVAHRDHHEKGHDGD